MPTPAPVSGSTFRLRGQEFRSRRSRAASHRRLRQQTRRTPATPPRSHAALLPGRRINRRPLAQAQGARRAVPHEPEGQAVHGGPARLRERRRGAGGEGRHHVRRRLRQPERPLARPARQRPPVPPRRPPPPASTAPAAPADRAGRAGGQPDGEGARRGAGPDRRRAPAVHRALGRHVARAREVEAARRVGRAVHRRAEGARQHRQRGGGARRRRLDVPAVGKSCSATARRRRCAALSLLTSMINC
ncbi:hypothetical protein DAI22_03g295900 [Oryza sativa Japonica Group]|nr:hypothetical protein DAI22_03g295900 [Oryza sativa Japonica Group]